MEGPIPNCVSVINGKGGVLKTTVTANTGGQFALNSLRTLLVDLDPQGNLGEDLGYVRTNIDDDGRALAQALMFQGGGMPVVKDVRPGLDVLVGGDALRQAGAGLTMASQRDHRGAKKALRNILEPLSHEYDLILIDCPPGEEMLQTVALAASRWALVPVRADSASRSGLAAVAARLDAVLDVNPTIELLGVVLTDVGTKSTAIVRSAREKVAELFDSPSVMFNTTIRHSESYGQLGRETGKLAHELEDDAKNAPKWWQVVRGEATATRTSATAGSVADDFGALAQEVADRISAKGNE